MAMSETEPLRLMISSRCRDTITYEGKPQLLSVVRTAMKQRLEAMTLGGLPVFRVWIHEDESNQGGGIGNWETCLEKSKNADVFVVLYNGRAGWLGTDSPVRDGIGICHAELESAYNKTPSKVRTLRIVPPVEAKPNGPDAAFQAYVTRLGLPGAEVSTGEEVLERTDELAAAIVLGLAREGVGLNTRGGYYAGEALEWSRMNFHRRREAMIEAVTGLLRRRSGAKSKAMAANVAVVDIAGSALGFVCDAVPGSMSTAAARELVGQPFLRDHEHTRSWEAKIAGPVHVIACQKSITEAQALRQLGFPDAIVVTHPFGVYVADAVQKIQMAFVANCRDETTTRKGVQTFLNWLNDHGEARFLVERARHRRQIGDLLRTLGRT